ncbi:MAG TPA: CpsD/CapB family tyrosine-protein kinase [Terriglobia bacterium]|nr:CpsD/CapB family tyrosine-protein kinase [Terriglobia bacterium]
MSRNYEILRRADKGGNLFVTPPLDRPASLTASPGLKSGTNGRNQSYEEIVKLVQRVFLTTGSSAPQVVTFCAIEHGNGCSWVMARAGEVLALQGERPVCLVDANLKTPWLEKHFHLDNRTGLTDAIVGGAPLQEYMEPVGGSLWVMTTGMGGPEMHNVLSSERFRARVEEMRSNFAHVLIDAPPLNRYADAALLGGMSDGMILVLEANVTRRETVRRVKENLVAAKVKLLGTVLNKRTYPIPEGLYHRF